MSHPYGQMSAGGAIFPRLKALGVDYVFVNSGTDFPPIIEGLAEAEAKDIPLPNALVIPYEHAAVAMAHGYYLASGQAQAVLLHTNVGLANGAIGVINAATDHIPMLVMSGRTPVMEKGRFGARTLPIGWGQEMRDQTALVRESTKWDYELRFPEQVPELLDRGYAIANSTPKGPVYLSLPREVLCESCPNERLEAPPSMAPERVSPSSAEVARLAEILAKAERPMIVAQRGAGSVEGFAALSRLAKDWAIPVIQYWANQLAIAADHPMQAGEDPDPWISEADVILVLDSLAPWVPDKHNPRAECRIIHVGPSPLHSRFPARNFRSDLSLVSETAEAILALEVAMEPLRKGNKDAIANRYQLVTARTTEIRNRIRATAEAGNQSPMTAAWVARCVSKVITNHKATVVHELGCPLGPLELKEHGSWYLEPYSGGLGWGLPCAMGIKLADPERLVIATVGDGSYIFANPVACHQVAERYQIPILTIILNNAEWGAVHQSVLGLYPTGFAAKAKDMPLTRLLPSPDFTKVAEASHAYTEKVTEGQKLPLALERAVKVVTKERRQAVLDVSIASE